MPRKQAAEYRESDAEGEQRPCNPDAWSSRRRTPSSFPSTTSGCTAVCEVAVAPGFALLHTAGDYFQDARTQAVQKFPALPRGVLR